MSGVRSDAPIGQGMTISDQLARHARRTPGRLAYRCEGIDRTYTDRTYAELDARVDRVAWALAARGVRTGDRVAVMAWGGLETVEVYFACARLGAICVPVNFRLTAAETAYILADSGASLVVADGPAAPVIAQARRQAPAVRHVLLIAGAGAAEGARAEGPDTPGDYEEALRRAPRGSAFPAVDEHSPAFIMYTSGTTGRPKGAVLTHRNLLIQTISTMVDGGLLADCRTWLSAVPLFHIAGVAGLMPAVFTGGTVVMTRPGAFDPVRFLDLLERERIAFCFLVPTQWQAVCAVPDVGKRDLLALRRIAWGAAPASTALLRTLIATFPQAEVSTAFGQTECSPVTTVLRGADQVRKIGSVGTALLNVEVRIVDPAMNDVPPGEIGEIVYRGPTVMREYWNKPAETADAFSGGWFHSGDLVREDEDGYLYVVDRLKDMIISGGENIYCAEVEEAVTAHPKVAEAAVIGVPDERWGETPLAVVVPARPADPPSAEEIEQWCRTRLAAYKCPQRVDVVAELPRNAGGKVLKTELRQRDRARAAAIPTAPGDGTGRGDR